MKKVLMIQSNNSSHWVGDGFPVRSIFSYEKLGKELSPFLLMDYAGPTIFPPTDKKKGVGEHPHRGFETVTIVYAGEVEHKDSSGGGGKISTGDVQWMTAASGIVHEEFHSKEFSKTGGPFEIIQLWVNLPKKYKMQKPRYQGIKSKTIPVIDLPDASGTLRIIAGEYNQIKGPALTFTPINLWDIKLNENKKITLIVPEGQTCSIFVMSGIIETSDLKILKEAEIAIFETTGNSLTIKAEKDTKILFLGGETINESIVGYGPFVMNTRNEIQEAILDYQMGKMGNLGRIEGTE